MDNIQPFISDKFPVRILFNLLERHGVRHIVASPGSRNAPLLLEADSRGFRLHMVIDERSAAFCALGIMQATAQPVALLCTSGTALLNYAPAVAEAYYQGLPLIVISADRPREWIDQDDSQTIRQYEALRNFVKGSYQISDSHNSSLDGWYENRIVNEALLMASGEKRGPVHINFALSEPLTDPYDPPAEPLVADEGSPSPHSVGEEEFCHEISHKVHYGESRMDCRTVERICGVSVPDIATIRSMASELLDKRVLVVCGFHMPDHILNRAVGKLRRHANVAVMAETLSNLHLPHCDYAIDAPLSVLGNDAPAFYPDIVISCGGALVSRMLKDFLRKAAAHNPRMQHWSVGYSHNLTDCFQALSREIQVNDGKFLSLLESQLSHLLRTGASNIEVHYAWQWEELRNREIKLLHSRISAATADDTVHESLTEAEAFQLILNTLPSGYNLQLSNGTPVRYAQLLTEKVSRTTFCNRGVSGIEGSTSTAAGASVASRNPVMLITGDTSFTHDLGGLNTAKMLGCTLKIIVIDNAGGGIFRFIRSTRGLEQREKLFCTDPSADVETLAKAFGFEYSRADTPDSLRKALKPFFKTPGRSILHVKADPEGSASLLRSLLNT